MDSLLFVTLPFIDAITWKVFRAGMNVVLQLQNHHNLFSSSCFGTFFHNFGAFKIINFDNLEQTFVISL